MEKFLLYSLLIFLAACTSKEAKFEAVFQELQSSVRQQYIPDKRVGIWDVDYRFDGGRITLKGITTSPEAKKAFITELEAKNYQVTDSLQLLPDESALEGKIYGIVNLSVCNIRTENDFSSEMVTQALLGMPVKVLQQNEWYRIQTPDNYIGWVHRTGIVPMTKQEYNEWNTSEKLIVTSHYGFAYESPDATSQPVSDLVAGDRLRWEGVESGFYKVSYPGGRKAYVAKSIATPEKEWRISLSQDAGSIIRTARSLMGIPYLWAGTSSKGVDCSGFVRTVLYLHDIIIPRDASQQAYAGEHIDIAPDFNNLQPGDLLFFGRPATADGIKERIIHVAIYSGGKRFIHSQGYVQTGSFDREDNDFDEYNLNRLLFAGRILPSVNKSNHSEVNTTLTNPYYQPQE
ncbi:Gamma-D-glutamyl-L-lysine endopeptidase [termite gut metagenome]|uniref:Gamma-D-glutamyl-L-lysine endopeptidase n=1 Tax=termite gut metagenome TaxID=433724 RepID=A0A5J4SCK6_9ZZZZ